MRILTLRAWLPLLWLVATARPVAASDAAAATSGALTEEEQDVVVQLDDDNDNSYVTDVNNTLMVEYKYDVDAIHEQWKRDLEWNDELDQEIQQRHQHHMTLADAQRRLNVEEASIEQTDFVKSLYQGDPSEEVSCFIGYKSLKGRQEIIRAVFADETSKHPRHDFKEVNSIAVTLPKARLVELIEDLEHIEFIEPDQPVSPNQLIDQVTPYGIKLSQGGGSFPYNSPSSPSSCRQQQSFKVAIIDAGYDIGHPDLPCSTENAANCLGSSFGLRSSEQWYNPARDHGTHVSL
jgi:hypothetical protein